MRLISDTNRYLNSYRDAGPLKESDKRDQNCPVVRKFWREDEAAAKTFEYRANLPPGPDSTFMSLRARLFLLAGANGAGATGTPGTA